MRLSRGLILGSISVLVTSAAAALFVQSCHLRQRTVYTDGATIRRPMANAPIREILWTPPQALPGSVNAPGDVYEAKLSADGLTLVFVRGKPGGNADLFIAHRTSPGDDHAWTDAQPLSEINTDRDELGPELSRDGSRLYFYSNRAGGLGGYDLWLSERGERGGRGWKSPVNLGPAVNSQFHEYSPALAHDGTQLFFASNRPRSGDSFGSPSQSWAATLGAGADGRSFDLYAAIVREGGFDHAAAVDAVNTPYDEGAPAFSPAGDFLYFASNRPGGSGGFDLYRSRLLRGRFLEPLNLDSPINTIDNELDPALSMDGFALYFSSDRALSRKQDSAAVEYKLYSSRSREVFTEIDAAGAGIDWAGLWHKLWPSLLWLLLGLLGLLALLALLKGVQSRRLSLLARCILASLLVHAMLMFLLSLWQVTTSIAGLLNRGEMKVAITSAGAGEALYAQIRGSLTQWSPSAVADVITPAQAEMPVQEVERIDVPQEHAPVAVAFDATPTTPVPDAAAPPMEHVIAPLQQQPAIAAIDPAVELPQTASAAAVSEAALTMARTASVDAAAKSEPAAVSTPTNHAASVEPLRREVAMAESTHREVDVQSTPLPERNAAEQSVAALSTAILPAAPTSTKSVNLPASDLPRASDEPARIVQAQPSAPSRAAVNVPSSTNASTTPARVDAPQLALPPSDSSATIAADVRESMPEMSAASSSASAAPTAPPQQQHAVATALPRETPTTQSEETQTGRLAALPPTTRPSELPTGATEAATAHTAALEPKPLRLPDVESTARDVESAAALPTIEPQIASSQPVPSLPLNAGAEFSLPTERTAPGEPRTPDRDAMPVLARVAPMRLEPRSDAPSAPAIERQELEPSQISIDTPQPDQRIEVADIMLDDAEVKDSFDRQYVAAAKADLSRLSLPMLNETDLKLPLETEPPPNPYADRAPEKREQVLEERGGSDETEQAVARALQWLAAHQGADGRWSSRQFDQRCGSCGGEARYDADIAITGLALLCFLGADHTHMKPGPYQDNVRRGVQWLAGRQKPNGDLRGDETMYSHGIATIALSEAFGMTRDESLLATVQNAVNFIASARNTRSGGWRYEPGQVGDTSVLGWQIMALVSATRSGLDVAPEALHAGREWLDRVAAEPGRGLYAYQPGQRYTHAMTAEGMFVLQLLGEARNEARMRESAEFVAAELPRWHGEANTYYWYYGTLAMFQHQGEPWRKWNAALKEHLLANQRLSGPAAGSWDPADNWARIGGRIYQTAMCTLSLEVYYRYLPLYSVIDPQDE